MGDEHMLVFRANKEAFVNSLHAGEFFMIFCRSVDIF